MIPARALLWDPAPDGHRRVSLEAALVVYNREGKVVNWLLRQINLNPDAAHYTAAQTTGVNFFLEIDAPDNGSSLRGGIYDLHANLAGTLQIPLSAVVNSTATTSFQIVNPDFPVEPARSAASIRASPRGVPLTKRISIPAPIYE